MYRIAFWLSFYRALFFFLLIKILRYKPSNLVYFIKKPLQIAAISHDVIVILLDLIGCQVKLELQFSAMTRPTKRARQQQAARKIALERKRDIIAEQEIQHLEVKKTLIEAEEEEGDGFTRERQYTQEEIEKKEAAHDWEEEEAELAVEFEEELQDALKFNQELQVVCKREDNRKRELVEKEKKEPKDSFGIVMKAASNDNWKENEKNLRAVVYTGESERQRRFKRVRAQSLAKEAQSMPQITRFFKPASAPPPILDKEFVEFEDVQELARELDWAEHIVALDQYLKDHKNLSSKIINCLIHLRSYMTLRRDGRGALEASKLVAETLDRGPYYAAVLRARAKDFINNRLIPVSKQGQHFKVRSLLEDEDVELAVAAYLREHKFQVTPTKLKEHLEKEVFPTLGMSVKPTTIHEKTVQKWMKKKGWVYGMHKKGVHVDGHERADVVIYRKMFLEEMQELEKFMVEYDDVTLKPLENANIKNGAVQQHILVTHDESTFHVNDDKRYSWAPKGEQPLKKKVRGKGLMISDFLLDTVGRLAVPEDVYAAIEEPPFPREACEVFEYGGEKGYWTGEHVVKQVD